MTEKGKGREKRRKGKAISSFVVLAIVLSVLAASVATVSGQLEPPEPTKIVVTANPESIPTSTDVPSISNITVTVTEWDQIITDPTAKKNHRIVFVITDEGTTTDAYLLKGWDRTDENGIAYTDLIAGSTPGTVVVKAYYHWNESVFDKATVTLTEEEPPEIVGYAPPSPVSNNESESRTFNITVNQMVDVSWQINGTEVSSEESVTESSYTNASAVLGTWNVVAIASNENGTDMQTWIWNVGYIPVVASIEVSPSDAALNVSETQQFSATAYDQHDHEMPEVTFAWSVSNGTVGTVDGNGLFTASYLGFTYVYATNASIVGSASVTVGYVPVVTTVEVSPESAQLNVGGTKQFTATAYDQYEYEMPAVEFTWEESNGTVGTVDGNGLFTASTLGFTYVNATANEKTGSAEVNVTELIPFTRELLEGWNMFGVPLDVNNWTLPPVLESIEEKYNIVIYYNATSGETEFFDPLIPGSSTLKELEPLAGYWIDTKEACTLECDGMKFIEPSRDLEIGWNMFSVPYGVVNETLPTVLSSIEENYTIVIYYNATSGETEFFDPLIPGASTLKELKPGAGYWIDMKVKDTFIPEME